MSFREFFSRKSVSQPAPKGQKPDGSSDPSRAERLFGNIGVTPFGALVFGFVVAVLLLISDPERFPRLAVYYFWVVVGLFLVTVVGLLWVKFGTKDPLPRLAQWGVAASALLGFGLGILVYHFRVWGEWAWFKLLEAAVWLWGAVGWAWLKLLDGTQWLWNAFSKLGSGEWLLVSLFLIGVIMGFYVVRNWSKEQADFAKSLTGAVGGAFVSTLVGQISGGDGNAATKNAFAFYTLGFTVSGVTNLVVASLLIRAYGNNPQSRRTRAVLSFLYGPDKADDVDKQFVRNFENDPANVRRLLINAVIEYQKRILVEFAACRQIARQEHSKAGLRYYQLLSIECEKSQPGATGLSLSSPPLASPPSPNADVEEKVYATVFCEIPESELLSDKMFRVATSFKWRDNLEFLDPPGSYKKPMQYFSSVSGMALFVRQTIVMDRDKYKRFRTTEYQDGICPGNIEQRRGLDEIDFLSYIVVPIFAHIGQPEETPLGILHIDTNLFAAKQGDLPPDVTPLDTLASPPIEATTLRASMRASQLTELATKIYDTEDKGVKYLEQMKGVLVPILQLYLKSRQGSA